MTPDNIAAFLEVVRDKGGERALWDCCGPSIHPCRMPNAIRHTTPLTQASGQTGGQQLGRVPQ